MQYESLPLLLFSSKFLALMTKRQDGRKKKDRYQ